MPPAPLPIGWSHGPSLRPPNDPRRSGIARGPRRSVRASSRGGNGSCGEARGRRRREGPRRRRRILRSQLDGRDPEDRPSPVRIRQESGGFEHRGAHGPRDRVPGGRVDGPWVRAAHDRRRLPPADRGGQGPGPVGPAERGQFLEQLQGKDRRARRGSPRAQRPRRRPRRRPCPRQAERPPSRRLCRPRPAAGFGRGRRRRRRGASLRRVRRGRHGDRPRRGPLPRQRTEREPSRPGPGNRPAPARVLHARGRCARSGKAADLLHRRPVRAACQTDSQKDAQRHRARGERGRRRLLAAAFGIFRGSRAPHGRAGARDVGLDAAAGARPGHGHHAHAGRMARRRAASPRQRDRLCHHNRQGLRQRGGEHRPA